MKIWKKNVIAAAVLLAVCGGIYVNWLFGEDQTVADLTDKLDEDKLLGSDLVMGDGDEDDTQSSYFAAVRLSRQQARDTAVSLLQEAMAYGSDVEAAQTNEQLEQIVQTALCEAQIESLVIAKGYADCVAYIGENGISVAVAAPEGGMKQADVAVIADIILSQSTFTMQDIHVVEVP